MGVILLLKFALLCIDYLAWPVIALGYPLVVSVRAVETDSKYHMKKIPLWDSIKLIATIWLVMPGFEGACHAYEILVRPVLTMDVQAVTHSLYWYNRKGDKHLTRPTFVEQYIKENGLEALERLIATKQECNKLEREILVLEAEGKNNVSTSQQMQYAETPAMEKSKQEWRCDICKVRTTSETTLNAHLQGSKHRSNCESLKGSMFNENDTRTSKKSILGSLQKSKQDDETAPIKKYKKEWKCDLCKVTTTSETTLNAHLQGSKHRSNCDSLKGNAGDTRPSSSRSTQESSPKQKQDGGNNQIFNLHCNVCSLKLLSNIDLASHIKGKRHISNIAKTSTMK